MDKIDNFLNKNFDEYEIYQEKSEYKSISFESNNLKEISVKQSQGFAVRAKKDSKITFSSSSNYDLKKFQSHFLELSNYSIDTKINFPSKSKGANTNIFNKEDFNISNNYFIDKLKKEIDSILKKFPNALCDAGFNLAIGETNLTNSNNLSLNIDESLVSFFISAQIINGNDMLNIYKYDTSVSNITEEKISSMTESLKEDLSIAQKISSTPKKGCPVVFTPHGLYQTILSPLLVSFSGTNLSKKLSSLCDREGEKIFDKNITLYDDPHIDLSPSSRNYDGEGIPTKKNVLIQDGKFINGIYDLKTASESGKDTTGSAGRSLHSNPSPSTSNIVMQNGENDFLKIIKNIDEGILVDHLLGAGQGNELSGDFSANISLGYKIEKGKIVGRVKNTMISGNAFKALSEIEEISSNTKSVYGSLFLPFLQTNNIEISS
ncbi:MAG: metallopeptidase TldD-related protein [Dehalococcoidia bacterium]|nr:metallopeptidase TldD-related protein [Dehalococcoidia bacterium]